MGLGEVLRERRDRRREGLAAVARRAKISPAYLYKLESDDVQEPSPHILHRLAAALETPYADLMDAAGYLLPGADPDPARLSMALFADLSEDERRELLAYLNWYRSRQDERAREPR
ncbi:MAG: HTH-type transcriptional regulator, competence development regulator [Chloroflexota bacterium]|jgi:transcriptional regulator with XRE-family HTH domain|nr:HTH-type transcriptional regulator, competence development regulator [Chloroflexota bacterium]